MYVLVDIQANAFLHHMVRNIVGSLLQIGLGNQSIEWITELLALKNRTQAAATAKPNGLYLVDVTYPEQHQLPRLALGPLFMLD
jgi:tRNA pseudouridine38-40 synthase